jgi:hypothetical protein
MMKFLRALTTLSILSIFGTLAVGGGSGNDPEFDNLVALIKPRPGEASWTEIPWLTDLWEARKRAAAEGKPIFVWMASGQSLGCT